MTDAYYDTSARPGVDERLAEAGWRREIGQLVRFEAALAPWDWSAIDSVLDLGCGPGGLARYMAETGRSARYVGIERRESAVDSGRDRLPEEADIRIGDLYDDEVVDETFDLVVAIGAHIDGEEPASDADRIGRVRALVERCHALADRGCSILVLDESTLRRRPVLDLEPALFGVTGGEMIDIVDEVASVEAVPHHILETDLVVHLGKTPDARERAPFAETTVYERVIEGYRERGGPGEDIAWLWLEVGRPDRAIGELVDLVDSKGVTDEIRHLFDRVRRSVAPG